MKDIEWPNNLSETDKEIILSYCNKKDAYDFASVYSGAKEKSIKKNILQNLRANDFKNMLNKWADSIGTYSYVSDEVMENITSALASNNLDADSLFIECKKLKPFTEHNDFLIDIIWRVLKTRDDGVWPQVSCPDFQDVYDSDRV